MSMSGTEREPESTAPDVSAVTGLRPGDSSTSTMPFGGDGGGDGGGGEGRRRRHAAAESVTVAEGWG